MLVSLGLVLSGGGIRGSAHIGVLKALHEADIKPSMISGTSAGSIVAGLYAYGYTPEEIGIIANRITQRRFDVDYSGIFGTLFGLMLHRSVSLSGLIRGNMLESAIRQITKNTSISEAKIPVAITAVDINNTNIVVFTSQKTRLLNRDDYIYLHNATFAEAIRASTAIPGIFQPKIINKMRLVDGGIRANLPVEIIRRMGARKVVAVNLGYNGNPVPYVDNMLEISMQALDMMIYQITRPSIDSADLIITPQIESVQQSDMSKIDYIINCGYEATKEVMPRIKRLMLR